MMNIANAWALVVPVVRSLRFVQIVLRITETNRAATGSVTALDFASKRIAMSLLGSLATVGNTLTGETVACFASSNYSLLFA